MEKIKILIADDIMILRQGLKAVLEQDAGLQVVALAENGREAFEKCKVFRPDVVLMDMRMPDYDGEYGIRAIKEQCPEIRVLVLTTFDDEETVRKAVSGGADGASDSGVCPELDGLQAASPVIRKIAIKITNTLRIRIFLLSCPL